MDFIPKGINVVAIIQCGGLWFANGKFGCTWRLFQAVVQAKPSMKGKCLISMSSTDKTALANGMNKNDDEQEQQEQQESVSGVVVEDDSDNETEVEVESAPTPAPAPAPAPAPTPAPVLETKQVEQTAKPVVKKKIVRKKE